MKWVDRHINFQLFAFFLIQNKKISNKIFQCYVFLVEQLSCNIDPTYRWKINVVVEVRTWYQTSTNEFFSHN